MPGTSLSMTSFALQVLFVGALMSAAQEPAGAGADVQANAVARFGSFQRETNGLASPAFVAIDAEGRTWITESHTGAVRVIGADGAEAARFVLEITPGFPREPHGIAISPAGEVFVADAVEQAVVVLDGAGLRKRTIGKRGAAPGEMREPRGIAIAAGKLYVADSGNHRIDVYALDGQFERALGRRGFGPGQLLAPNDVAVDATGRVFVADLGNQRIVRFEADGSSAKSWGGLGPFAGLFHAPCGIAERDGRVFVADRDNHRVQVFDADGKPDHEWGVHAVRPREGAGKLHYPSDVALAPKGDFAAVVEGLEGRVQFFGVANEANVSPPEVDRSATAHYEGGCDVAGNLLALLEPAGPSVSIFDMAHPTPIEITRFGRSGVAAGKMLVPADVEFASDGKSVWVSEPMLHRLSQYVLAYEPGGILKFDPYMAKFVRALQLDELPGVPATPWPTEPTALELGPDGRMYVADRANGRVLVLTPDMTFERVLGSAGTGEGKLLEPTAIVVETDETPRIPDIMDGRAITAGSHVRVADARARKIETWSSGWYADKCDIPASDGLRSKHLGSVTIPSASGTNARPFGMAAAGDNGLWVSLEDAHALVRLDGEGRITTTLGADAVGGLGKLQWFHPEGLARTADGSIVAIDAGNHRFQVFDASGAFLTAWGSRLFLEPILKAK